MSAFVPGLQLSRDLYFEVVRPMLDVHFPGLPHSAALMGRGSEVLGFDDAMSTDHDWKPRVLLFLGEQDQALCEHVDVTVRRELPPTFRDRPIGFETHTVRGYFLHHVGVDVERELTARDWLTLPEHVLRMFTAGEVFHDEVGLQLVRDRLAYYPRDVWLYLLLSGWWRVHPELNLLGRAGSVGDELGSALIGSRLVSDLMRLCFLMEREYAPYSKWFGTAFARLECGPGLSATLWTVMRAKTWSQRENALLAAYEALAEMHNALGITDPVPIEVIQLWDRPFKVVWGDFPGFLRAQIRDPDVLSIAERWPIGPVDQLRELLWPPRQRDILLRLFEKA